jgi:hypothetical protein
LWVGPKPSMKLTLTAMKGQPLSNPPFKYEGFFSAGSAYRQW